MRYARRVCRNNRKLVERGGQVSMIREMRPLTEVTGPNVGLRYTPQKQTSRGRTAALRGGRSVKSDFLTLTEHLFFRKGSLLKYVEHLALT